MPRSDDPMRAPGRSMPPPRGFLPDTCRIPAVLAVLVTAQLLAIMMALASPQPLSGFWERLGPLSLYVQLIALAGAALLCLLRPHFARLDDRLTATAAWALLLAVAAAVTWVIFRWLPSGTQHLLPDDGLPGLMARALGISAIVGVLLLRHSHLHHLWRSQVRAEANARLESLQARIRPHFLFNSINTITNLVHRDPRLAEELLEDLADLFRAALARRAGTATLAEELELSRRYLHIERQRLGDRMRIEWDLRDLPDNAPLPPLILQPLVENAVYHGIQPSRRPGRISIAGRYACGRVNLSIRNTLARDTNGEGHDGGNRMALANVRQRLAAMYPGAGRVTESRIDGDYQVRLVFPHPWNER